MVFQRYGGAVVTVEYNSTTVTVTVDSNSRDGTQLNMGSTPLAVGKPHTVPLAPFALAFSAAALIKK